MIGKESRRLSLQPRQPVWRLEEAAAFVEGELPFDVAANIDDGTMKQLLRIHLNQLQFTCGAGEGGQIAEEATVIQNVYRDARSQGVEVARPMVDAVGKAHLRYLEVIGALGAAPGME